MQRLRLSIINTFQMKCQTNLRKSDGVIMS